MARLGLAIHDRRCGNREVVDDRHKACRETIATTVPCIPLLYQRPRSLSFLSGRGVCLTACGWLRCTTVRRSCLLHRLIFNTEEEREPRRATEVSEGGGLRAALPAPESSGASREAQYCSSPWPSVILVLSPC